jgi:hypothetical protein
LKDSRFVHFGKEYYVDPKPEVDRYIYLVINHLKSYAREVGVSIEFAIFAGGGVTVFREVAGGVVLPYAQMANAIGYWYYGLQMAEKNTEASARNI